MRIVFAGTPDIAIPSLEAIADRAGWEIPLVLSQPDRPAGRGRKVSASPVKEAALARGLRVLTPDKPKDLRAELTELRPDVIAVVAYGHIFRRWLLELPRHGCVNLHFSLLPRHRGVAPVQWTILEGDDDAGVTVMRMDRGVDTGDVFRQAATPVGAEETAGELLHRLAALGAPALADTLADLEGGRAQAVPQEENGATYARKLEKDDGRVDWNASAVAIDRQVRGLSPWPGAFTAWRGTRLMIHAAVPLAREGNALAPGRLAVEGGRLLCGTGDGALELKRVQPEGKGPMEGEAWARGARPDDGDRLGGEA
ncbi:methionyl-tRNA formyltransferase [bacterium]|nr:methionyl-tRNA formyltransferase [bacterium]